MQTVVREEMWAAEEPRGPQYMNLNYIGPLLMRFGSPEQQARFLPPMARGDGEGGSDQVDSRRLRSGRGVLTGTDPTGLSGDALR